jgi:hypothetical protein
MVNLLGLRERGNFEVGQLGVGPWACRFRVLDADGIQLAFDCVHRDGDCDARSECGWALRASGRAGE